LVSDVTASRFAYLFSEANLPIAEMPDSSTPPVLPVVKAARVLRIARADAVGVVVCASFSLLIALPAQQWVFAGFSALALVCGAMEWHGQDRLREGEFGGLQWLIGAQACLYTVILGYALWRWQHFDPAAHWAEIPAAARDQLNAKMVEAGLDPEADRELLLRTMNGLICSVLVGGSTLYQVGLALWYRAQAPALAAALENPSTRRPDAG
jgi:type IV secretory pathway TrbD component